MKQLMLLLLPIALFVNCETASSQEIDTNLLFRKLPQKEKEHWLLPAGMITYGLFAQRQYELKRLDLGVKEEVWEDKPHAQLRVDNYLQFAPGATVFALNAFGVKGEHNFRDEAMLYLLSNAIMAALINPLKSMTRAQRPDGADAKTFPSGHTATAFVGAEFLRKEYGHESPWYSISGYAIATTVGAMRIYNNKHWMRDVVAGAGIGIASTKLAYLIYPKISRSLFGHKWQNTAMLPEYSDRTLSVHFVHRF